MTIQACDVELVDSSAKVECVLGVVDPADPANQLSDTKVDDLDRVLGDGGDKQALSAWIEAQMVQPPRHAWYRNRPNQFERLLLPCGCRGYENRKRRSATGCEERHGWTSSDRTIGNRRTHLLWLHDPQHRLSGDVPQRQKDPMGGRIDCQRMSIVGQESFPDLHRQVSHDIEDRDHAGFTCDV